MSVRGSGAQRLAVLVTVAALVAACAGDDDATTGNTVAPPVTSPAPDDGQPTETGVTTPEPATTAPATAPTTEPVDEGAEGGTLVVAITGDPGQLNPAITTSGAVHTAAQLMFNGLVSYDDELSPRPDLAESWEIEEDGALYRFVLRDDVVWHDGEPFTSADVAFSFEEILTEFHSRTAASVGAVLESVSTPDAHTVEFRFSEPYAPFLQQLDVTEAPIIPAHVYEGTDPLENPANQAPIGTGPFMFSSSSPDEQIVLEKNPNYHKAGLPIFDAVVMRVIPDPGSQVIALEAGEVDWLWGVPGPDLARLQGDNRFETLSTLVNPGGANCIMTMSFNLEDPMFQDVGVRRGIAHGLDRQAFVDRVLFGQGNVATAPIASGIPAAHADDLDLPSYDVDEASRLLDEAGWVLDGGRAIRVARGVDGVDDGTPLAFRASMFPQFSTYGELLKALLLEIGVDVEVVALEAPTFVEEVFTSRDFDTNIISYCNGTDPEVGVRRMYLSTNIGPIPFSNSSAYVNSQVDALLDEARGTVGPDERAAAYRELQEIVVEDLPYIWLVETTSTRIYGAECEGFTAFGHFAEAASCSGR